MEKNIGKSHHGYLFSGRHRPTEATAFVGKDPAKAKMAKDFISHVNSTAEEGAVGKG